MQPPQAYDWSFTGFIPSQVGGGDADATMSGRVIADDTKADGMFSKSEVLSFVYKSFEYVGCPQSPDGICVFNAFSHAPGGQLDFVFYRLEYGKARVYTHGDVGDSYGYQHTFPEDPPYIWANHWSDQTRFAISPVPEPHTFMMFGAGLLALSAAVRRRLHQR